MVRVGGLDMGIVRRFLVFIGKSVLELRLVYDGAKLALVAKSNGDTLDI